MEEGVGAVFFDRDGTLIEEKVYLSDPRQVVLLPGVATALTDLREGLNPYRQPKTCIGRHAGLQITKSCLLTVAYHTTLILPRYLSGQG